MVIHSRNLVTHMKTYSQFFEFLFRCSMAKVIVWHLFYDADKIKSMMITITGAVMTKMMKDDVNSKALLMKEDNIYFRNIRAVISSALNSRLLRESLAKFKFLLYFLTAGMKGLVNLVKLQKKRTKQISAYTVGNYGSMTSGVWSDGGGWNYCNCQRSGSCWY